MAGKLTGRGLTQGYWKVFLGGRQYLTHRIIWKLVHGVDPEFIDHIDGNRTNNALANLRSVTRETNRRNCCERRDGTSGFRGVRQRSPTLWQARIQANGVDRHLGNFKSRESAIQARLKAEAELGYAPQNGRPRND